MGVVNIDIHKTDRLFNKVTFNDSECVKGLIKNRSQIDEFYDSKLYDNTSDIYTASSVFTVDEEILCIYMDLERLIKKSKLNQKQLEIINYFFRGHSTSDICDMLGYKQSSIDRIMDTISNKIAEQNDIEYTDYLHYGGYVRVDKESRYKKCSKCEEFKDVVIDNFSVNKDSPDGFHSICKKCRK